MIFENRKLEGILSNYIETIFYHKGYMPEHNIEKVVPTGNVFIIMEFDGFERHTFDDQLQPTGSYRSVWVSGVHKSHINISAHQNSEMLVIQFKPHGAYPFIKKESKFYSNSVSAAEKIFGASILDVHREVEKETKINSKFQIIENWLINIFDEKSQPTGEFVNILDILMTNPFSKHKELVGNYSKTQKHLIEQFKKYCGLTPKEMHRIFRFNSVLATIHQKQEIQWTDIVYETGYSDQSHFIKEFQKFSGFNPSEYIKNKYNESIPNFFPLDDEG